MAARFDGLNQSGPLDVLVIGGGIVGSGVARDAAMRGLSTILVEARDFAFGTSGRSSRLLHGGLRYLAQGRVGLVREASREKMTLARIAPHLAAPLPFVFPTYAGTQWKRWKLSIGVKIYDLLCGQTNLGRSGTLSPEAAAQLLPGLSTNGLTGAVRYFDGLTCDARLVLDTLRSASNAGATVFNYAAASEPAFAGDNWSCRITDEETGEVGQVRSRVIVNAAGAWADKLPPSRAALRLTKGVHLVIDRSRLPIPEAVVMTDGGRILFAIPWGDRVILGTTDTDYAGPLDNPGCTHDDIAYVLGIVNRTFPAASITPADMISAWSGIRPLIADPNGKPSDISRAHQIRETQPGWIDVTGGKLTTYRLMAEQTVDVIRQRLGIASLRPCETATQPLLGPGNTGFSGIIPPAVSAEAVHHYCDQEWARHLDDVMIRRAGWHDARTDRLAVAETVSKSMAARLGWTADRLAAEYQRFRHMTETAAPHWTTFPANHCS